MITVNYWTSFIWYITVLPIHQLIDGEKASNCLITVIGTQKPAEMVSLFPHFDDTIPGPGDDHTLGGLTQVDVTDDVTVSLGWGFRPTPRGIVTGHLFLCVQLLNHFHSIHKFSPVKLPANKSCADIRKYIPVCYIYNYSQILIFKLISSQW